MDNITDKILKKKERSKKYYSNEENRLKHALYMKNYHQRNNMLLKQLKQLLKDEKAKEKLDTEEKKDV